MDIAKTLRESCFCEGRGCELCRAADEIERLRYDIERHIAIASEHATECERLRAELAECKRDAERYRWLRDPACTHPHIANDCAGDDMDRAFDRVMGKAALAADGEAK